MTIKKKIEEFKKQWLGKWYDEGYGYQCVAGVKKAVEEIYGIKLGSFGGSAVSGWDNMKNTFDPALRRRVENKGIGGPIKDMYPPIGAVVFWRGSKGNPYGHVAIVSEIVKPHHIKVIEQNGWALGTATASDDVFTERIKKLSNVAGWYIFNNKQKLKRDTHDRRALQYIINRLKTGIWESINSPELKKRLMDVAIDLFRIKNETMSINSE